MAVHPDMSRNLPVALTIAGSDSGGGAGIQADLKTFAALRVHGTCAITCVTAQNPRRVFRIWSCPPKIIEAQVEAVFTELRPAALKTGMLYSAENIKVIAKSLRAWRSSPVVVDPVMIATSGTRLIESAARKTMIRELLPLATLITPNLPEAEVLIDAKLSDVEDLRLAARQIYERFGCATLVKGGHLRGLLEAVDIFYDGRQEWLLKAPFYRGRHTHGTGCTYSAAITAYLAQGLSLTTAVAKAKEYTTEAIAQSQRVKRHWVLNNAQQQY
jgi:hydroxymethylpyrimidine/phosphomethylpyrimidine kinase